MRIPFSDILALFNDLRPQHLYTPHHIWHSWVPIAFDVARLGFGGDEEAYWGRFLARRDREEKEAESRIVGLYQP